MELIPSENFAVYNALARLLECARPSLKIKRPDGVVIYSMVKDDKPIAAVWNFRPQNKIFSTFTGFAVMDLFGNALTGSRYLLADAPYFLTASGMSVPEFEEKLRQISFELETTYSVSPVVRLVDAAKPYALVTVGNCSDREVGGLLGINGNGFTASGAVRFVLAPFASVVLQVPLKGTLAPGAVSVRVFGAGGNQTVTATGIVDPSAVAGQTIELQSADGALRANFEFRRDQGDWLLTVKVSDQTPSGAAGERKMWEQDSVELFFDPALTQVDLTHPGQYHDRVFRLFVLAYRDQTPLALSGNRLNLNMFPCNIERTLGGYEFTVRLPGDLLTDRFGFEIKVNDAVGAAKATRFASWSKSDQAFQDRTIFGIIQQP